MVRQRGSEDDWATRELLTRAAWHYYVEEMTQDDIAHHLGVSRASAGRLLERARKSGIVSFTIDSEYLESFEIARQLRDAYGLHHAVVLPEPQDPNLSQSETNRLLGKGAARYIHSHLAKGTVLGLGWGDTVHQTMSSLSADELNGVRIVTLTGGVGGYMNTLSLATGNFGAERDSIVLPTPLLASSESLADALRAENVVQLGLKAAAKADHALLSVGALLGRSTLAQMGYVDQAELDQLGAAGAVGDILGIFFDVEGRVVDAPIHRRRIGIELEDLAKIPNVVAVAGGMAKLPALRGALSGGYLSTLVTTEDVARALLSAAEQAA
jgi:lsr operon transcriptional repressor